MPAKKPPMSSVSAPYNTVKAGTKNYPLKQPGKPDMATEVSAPMSAPTGPQDTHRPQGLGHGEKKTPTLGSPSMTA